MNNPSNYTKTTLQFLLTPLNSTSPTGPTGAYGEWLFNGLGLQGDFDVNIQSVEYSAGTGYSYDSVLVLQTNEINCTYNNQVPGYMFSVNAGTSAVAQTPWTKREFHQPAQRFNGAISFYLWDYFAKGTTPQIYNMNYCLVTIDFMSSLKI